MPRCATSPRLPATASRSSLHMNAGLMADLPSLPKCGALGVGLFRTELQFLIRTTRAAAGPSSRRSTPASSTPPATSR